MNELSSMQIPAHQAALIVRDTADTIVSTIAAQPPEITYAYIGFVSGVGTAMLLYGIFKLITESR